MTDTPLATLHASPTRRLFAYVVLFSLGAVVIYLAFASAPSFLWQVFLVLFGASVLWIAESLRRATTQTLTLSNTGLSSSDGTVLALIEDIKLIDRGVFAMKPSNGFTLVLKTRQSRTWAPGLWWRSGKRVGVGGVTPSGASKFMAERIAMLLAESGSTD
jgi:hypothetical protein